VDSSTAISEASSGNGRAVHSHDGGLPANYAAFAIYAIALAASISTWFAAIGSPLSQDETTFFWSIKAGIRQIPFRQDGLTFPAYSCVLWLWTRVAGTSEIAMRMLSVPAMALAAYLLYLAAREIFEKDAAVFAAAAFCLSPVVLNTVDARPYAFAVLLENAAILAALRLRQSNSYRRAALLGLLAGWILWFQIVLGAILPALVVCFFAVKTGGKSIRWKQFGVALLGFGLAVSPVVPVLVHTVRTSTTHVYESAPSWFDLFMTLVPGNWWIALVAAAILVLLLASLPALRVKDEMRQSLPDGLAALVCVSLALIPLLIVFGLSRWTPLHMFAVQHRISAVPGIALCWAFLMSRFRFPVLRRAFLVLFAVGVAILWFLSPGSGQHAHNWKAALLAVQKDADGAPVVVCSDFPESNFASMPVTSVEDSRYFVPLSYYRLNAPVVPLPQDLNDEAESLGTRFLARAASGHERFLAVGDIESYKTLDWLAQQAAASYTVRKVGVFDEIEVLEFIPRVGSRNRVNDAGGRRDD
jgi:hypothetical protein